MSYLIHDNGGRPFRVNIENNTVNIYKRTYHEELDKFDEDLFLTYDTKKIFLGECKKYPGNTILLKVDSKYIFIGANIVSFKPSSKIVRFVSNVKNNDVPYPYAIDKKGIFYLFTENVCINVPMACEKNPYEYYCQASLITDDEGYVPAKKSLVKNFDNITKWYIGEEEYTFTYEPFPDKKYDVIRDEEKMFVVKNNKKIEIVHYFLYFLYK